MRIGLTSNAKDLDSGINALAPPTTTVSQTAILSALCGPVKCLRHNGALDSFCSPAVIA